MMRMFIEKACTWNVLPRYKFYTTYIQCITSELCYARLFKFFFKS